jgi:hypothetical protein
MSLEHFREIDLLNGQTIINSFKHSNLEYLYPIQGYYFGIKDNLLNIYNENFELIICNNILLDTYYKSIYLSLYSERLVIQTVLDTRSNITIYNKDFTLYKSDLSINTDKQLVYIWNNQPVLVHYEKNTFGLYSIDGILYYKYYLPITLISYSNIVCFNRDLYILGLLHDNYYIFIKLGENLKYSNYFSIDYDNINSINIDYYNDVFQLSIIQKDKNVINIKKNTRDSFIHKLEKVVYTSIPEFLLTYKNNLSIHTDNHDLNLLKTKLKNRWIDEIVFDFSILPKYIEKVVKPTRLNIENTIIPSIPKIIYVQSNKYFEYFKWIVDNYDTCESETVVFYNNLQYKVSIEFADNIIINTLDNVAISNNIENFIMTFGKVVLSDGYFYIRTFKKINMYENLLIGVISSENKTDFYTRKTRLLPIELEKILRFLLLCNIRNNGIIYWTPNQYFKINMKLILSRSKDYWEKIYNRLNTDLNLEYYMPYLFYNILKG